MTFGIVSCLLFLLSFSLVAKDAIPESLTPWVSWVLKGNENLSCPFINNSSYAETRNHICAWPSTLELEVKDSSAKFKQSWQVLSKSIIPLPGSKSNWPLLVTVNNKYFPVFNHHGRPAIELTKGSYLIEGKFEWLKIPESIAVPEQYPASAAMLLKLTLS